MMKGERQFGNIAHRSRQLTGAMFGCESIDACLDDGVIALGTVS
jgi:hypothetical protein